VHSFPDFVVFLPFFKPVCFTGFFLIDRVAAVNKGGCHNCSDNENEIFTTHKYSPERHLIFSFGNKNNVYSQYFNYIILTPIEFNRLCAGK